MLYYILLYHIISYNNNIYILLLCMYELDSRNERLAIAKKTLGGGQWIGFVGDLFFSGNHGYDEK